MDILNPNVPRCVLCRDMELPCAMCASKTGLPKKPPASLPKNLPSQTGASISPLRKANVILIRTIGRTSILVAITYIGTNLENLIKVESGALMPDPTSRLGAFAATLDYNEGTVGYGVHIAIALIYLILGDNFDEEIGTFYNSAKAKAQFPHPADSPHNLQFATLEYEYWSGIKSRNSNAVGATLALAFSPESRAVIQALCSKAHVDNVKEAMGQLFSKISYYIHSH